MAERLHHVALALVELEGKRVLPLTGKSQSAAAAAAPEQPSKYAAQQPVFARDGV